MESIIDLIKIHVFAERLNDIEEFAKTDLKEWEETRREIEEAHKKLEEKGCRKEALELDNALASEEVELQKAAYLLGLADGMALARFGQEQRTEITKGSLNR